MASHFEELGGEPRLRAIIDSFVDRVFSDPMIGFFFARVGRQRVKDKEYEFAAQHLGGGVIYSGRPIAVAHASHSIASGHFMRRMQILKDTLSELNVPGHIAEAWLAHNLALRDTVTSGRVDDCEPNAIQVKETATKTRGGRALPVTRRSTDGEDSSGGKA